MTVLMGTAPDFLDPQEGYTTQSAEATWISYLGLYTYAHKNGEPGGKVIPGLAQDFPTLSSDGKTYTLTLRPGLSYSDGSPVKASDFTYTIERALKLNWGGKSFFTGYIKGAEAYDTGKSHTISGIETDDNSGKITIALTKPYGAFLNVLSFPSAGLVPTGTKMSNLSNDPPPGVGPYEIKDVIPNRSFDVVRNPKWTSSMVPGRRARPRRRDGQDRLQHADRGRAGAQQLGRHLRLGRPDPAQPRAAGDIAGRGPLQAAEHDLDVLLLPEHSGQAVQQPAGARKRSTTRSTGARSTASTAATSRRPAGSCPRAWSGIRRAPARTATPTGRPTWPRPRRWSSSPGMEGQPVTVWCETRSPRKEFVSYYTDVLNQIGFKAKSKIIADAQYFATIGNSKSEPQTGFADWNQDFPNPSDFYLLMDADSIQAPTTRTSARSTTRTSRAS